MKEAEETAEEGTKRGECMERSKAGTNKSGPDDCELACYRLVS